MNAAIAIELQARLGLTGVLPQDLEPLTRSELARYFTGGEPEADECEQVLAWAARARGGVDLAVGEGLHALKHGDRLAQLGFHLVDYAREVLDLGETTTRKLVRLGAELRNRKLLREALRSGRVGIRAAETVLPVAAGDSEATWVERAELLTVRELEEAVRRERAGLGGEDDEEWVRISTHLPTAEREAMDLGLEVAGHVEPGLGRLERLEAMAQEILAELPTARDVDDTRPLGAAVRAIGEARGDAARRELLERETERWGLLPKVDPIAAPDEAWDECATAGEIDARLRELAAIRASFDELIGWCAHAIRRSGMAGLLGFATFRHYVEERLGLPPRAVEQREALERRLWASPALREARRHKVSYERLRVLARLPERDIRAWIPRAQALTCIELRRRVEGERERQMRAARKLVVAMPRRLAVLLATAVHAVRGWGAKALQRAESTISVGKCLAIMGLHFAETWEHEVQPARTPAQKVRERDAGLCQVPGCSRRAEHSHHVEYRSRGGSDEPSNQVSVCSFHHLRCIHGGYLRVVGRAPDGLRWLLGGEPWNAGLATG